MAPDSGSWEGRSGSSGEEGVEGWELLGCPQLSQLRPGHLHLWGGTSPRGASRTWSRASCLRRAAGLGLAPCPDAGRPPDSPFWLSLPARNPSRPVRLPEGAFQSKGQMADLVTPAPAPKPANDTYTPRVAGQALHNWPKQNKTFSAPSGF